MIMRNMFVFLIITILIVLGIVIKGCEKDEERSERFKLLTAHIWNHDSLWTICQDPEISYWIHMFDSLATGVTITYSDNGTFITKDGAGEGFESGGWKFSNEETEIVTFDDEAPSDIYGHYRIEILTDDVLEYTDLADVPPSDTCWVKARWVK
jgi:hypothetical protein